MLALYLEHFDSDYDKGIFSKLYEDYEKLLYKIAFKLLNNKQLAEDAVHDTFMELIRGFETFLLVDDKRKKAYIYKIGYRCAIKIYNKEFDLQKTDPTDELNALFEQGADKEFWSKVDKEELSIAVKGLAEKYRLPLLLKYDAEFNYAQISEILNITEETARQRVSRAKEKLRLVLENGE